MTQPHPQQTASKMCDNFLEELHDLLKEFGDSEDYRFVEAVVDLHERILLWKQRPDVCATHTPAPAAPGHDNEDCLCEVCQLSVRQCVERKNMEHAARDARKDEREKVLDKIIPSLGQAIQTDISDNDYVMIEDLDSTIESLRGGAP